MLNARKIYDLGILVCLVLLAVFASLAFSLSFLPSTLLFLFLPTVYLAFRLRRKSQLPRIIAMALVFGLWYGFLFAYLADWNLAWGWPAASLPWGYWFSILNPVEWLWVFLWVVYIVLFYEHFIERDTSRKISYRISWAIVPAAFATAVVVVSSLWFPGVITWPYAYAVLAVLTLPPALLLLVLRPRVYKKIWIPLLFFVPMHLLQEITGLLLGHWYFPGQYFLLIPMPGGTVVPIEEFIIWIVLGSMLVLAYYELYIDDGK